MWDSMLENFVTEISYILYFYLGENFHFLENIY